MKQVFSNFFALGMIQRLLLGGIGNQCPVEELSLAQETKPLRRIEISDLFQRHLF